MLYVPLFLIILIVALPQLSETIYSPALPQLAYDLCITDNFAEYTFTIYLMGFAVGVLIWGNLSDYYGRKPFLLIGFLIYFFACLGCYIAGDITFLLIARFFQAFGASVGSVIGQAIARDTIRLEDRGKMFSTISIAMAFAPAIGPVIGGLTIEFFNWTKVFIVLMSLAVVAILLIIYKLPETNLHKKKHKNLFSIYKECFFLFIKDPRVIGFACLIGAINGILFGYFAEAPFFFIKKLGVHPTTFGIISFFLCVPLSLGGIISRSLHTRLFQYDIIIRFGIYLMGIGAILFMTSVYFGFIQSDSPFLSIVLSLLWTAVIMTGLSMVMPNCFSHALEPYGKFSGTASSLFGFLYYILISAFTGLMGYMHNGTLFQLPLFILILVGFMILIFKTTIEKNNIGIHK